MRFQDSKDCLRGLLTLFLLLGSMIRAQAGSGPRPADYGADLEIGGAGAGYGKFAAVTDMAFDKNNTLYVLDTRWQVNGSNRVNYLIQRFSDAGQFQTQYSIYDARLGAKNAPAHIALDTPGYLYLTQPLAGLVRQYNSSGVLVRDFTLPSAFAVAVRNLNGQEQILVVPQPGGQSVQQVSVFYADGRTGTPIHLSRALTNCYSLATDKSGCFYALADVNQVYKFDPNGVLLTILGSGLAGSYNTDGSVLANSVQIDSKGCVYSLTPGNPGYLTKFSADLTTESQRPGLFSWCDAWTYCNLYGGSYAPIAVDRKDRVWVGVNGTFGDGELDAGNPMHFRAGIFRTAANYLDAGQYGATQKSALGIGLMPSLANYSSPNNEFHTLSSTQFAIHIAAATRRVSQITVNYVIYDVYKKPMAQGKFDATLQDGVDFAKNFLFQPSKWGWYQLQYTVSSNGVTLKSGAAHLGFTPPASNLPNITPGEIWGGPVDPARQADVQLKLIRTSTSYGLDAVDQQVAGAAKYGLTMLVQMSYAADCAPNKVQQAVTPLQGARPLLGDCQRAEPFDVAAGLCRAAPADVQPDQEH